jgi:hypothetical protein
MKHFKLLLAAVGLVLNVALSSSGLLLVSCATSKPKATYHFKPGPAYGPGPTPYKGVRYPNHP